MIKFFKELYSNDNNGSLGDYLLTIFLWLVTVIGGSYTIGEIGRALTACNKKLGDEFGIFCIVAFIGIAGIIFTRDWLEEEKTYKKFQENIRKCEEELESEKLTHTDK